MVSIWMSWPHMLEGGEDGQFIEVIDEEDGEHVRVFH